MPHERFDELRERLLRAGVAPRHVRRYVAELRDHFDDLVREEMDGGATRDAATLAARARIGSDDKLSDVMLARPGVRSMTARYPWAAFGVGPLLMLAFVVASALFIQGGLISWSPPIPQWSIPWVRLSFDVLNWLTTYAAPLAIALILVVIGIRQRMSSGWILLGLAIVCVVGGFHEIGAIWSTEPAQPSELALSFALAPPFPRDMLIAGAFCAAINLAIVGTVYGLWLRVRPPMAE
jgi:hypothetical protein